MLQVDPVLVSEPRPTGIPRPTSTQAYTVPTGAYQVVWPATSQRCSCSTWATQPIVWWCMGGLYVRPCMYGGYVWGAAIGGGGCEFTVLAEDICVRMYHGQGHSLYWACHDNNSTQDFFGRDVCLSCGWVGGWVGLVGGWVGGWGGHLGGCMLYS